MRKQNVIFDRFPTCVHTTSQNKQSESFIDSIGDRNRFRYGTVPVPVLKKKKKLNLRFRSMNNNCEELFSFRFLSVSAKLSFANVC